MNAYESGAKTVRPLTRGSCGTPGTWRFCGGMKVPPIGTPTLVFSRLNPTRNSLKV